MSGKKGLVFCLSFVFFILSLPLDSFFQEKTEIEDVELPSGWVIQKTIHAPKDKLDVLSQRLGGELVSAVNYILDVDGVMLRVNVAEAKTRDDAKTIYQAFFSLHKKEEECLLKGKKVFEFLSSSFQLIQAAHSLFKSQGNVGQDLMKDLEKAVWEVEILAAPIKKADYMSANDMFVLLKSHTENPRDTEVRTKITQLKERFTFSNKITLRYETPSWGTPEYSIQNAQKISQEDDVITFKIKESETKLGVPCVRIKGQIPVKKASFYNPDFGINKSYLTSSTTYWPTDHKKILSILDKILEKGMNTQQKVQAICDWISKNLKFGGTKIGTRYGVLRVLTQRSGRCWDFCDVFVTLCRAAEIPTRQVMGWIHGKSGHVWAEVYFSEKGWFPFDPTAPSSQITTDYVPFFISENGELPAIYWKEPSLQRIHN